MALPIILIHHMIIILMSKYLTIHHDLCKSSNILTIGYYADIANECQVFHICQPVTYADGETETFKWSMICPEQTVFDQVLFILNIRIPT